MQISDCIFYTGTNAGATLPSPGYARDVLDELFTHSDGVSPIFYEELLAQGLRIPKPPVRVVTIAPGLGEAPFSMRCAVTFAELVFERLPELLRQDGLFYYVNSRIQGVVSCGGEEQSRALYQSMRELVELQPKETRPHVAISNQYDSLEQISKACDENQEAHVFARFLTNAVDVLVQPKDFYLYGGENHNDENADDDAFFGTSAQKICNAMIMGKPERMHQVLDDVLDYMVGKFPRVSAVHMRAIHFCKPLEMTLVGADLIDRLFVQKFRLVQRVIETENEAELRAAFHTQMDTIWEYVQQRKRRNHGELMHQIAEYIAENLSDSSLSILTIAEVFHMRPSRLSALFREYFQESIPDFIHRQRTELIKQKLLTTNMTIQSIAEDVGYISIATMNRAFLKNEGLYPGQYRKKMRIDTEEE